MGTTRTLLLLATAAVCLALCAPRCRPGTPGPPAPEETWRSTEDELAVCAAVIRHEHASWRRHRDLFQALRLADGHGPDRQVLHVLLEGVAPPASFRAELTTADLEVRPPPDAPGRAERAWLLRDISVHPEHHAELHCEVPGLGSAWYFLRRTPAGAWRVEEDVLPAVH